MYPKIYPTFLECGCGVQAAEYYMLCEQDILQADFCHRHVFVNFHVKKKRAASNTH